MKIALTGCAGFIGSNFLDDLILKGHDIIGIDNLSTGRKEFLEKSANKKNFKFINEDLFTSNNLEEIFKSCELIIHFSANADVRFGLYHTSRDLNQNTIVTYKILEAMRKNKIKKIIFSSTGSVYGESKVIPTPENVNFPIQTSLYAASKLAAESLISSYSYGFEIQSWIFRFVSILGPRYSHGHVFDFYKKLINNKNELEVLGNGKQRKSYLHIDDCISGINTAFEKTDKLINIFNLGTDDYCEVNDSIKWITKELNVNPKINYTGGDKGWIGDNPFIYLDTSKIRGLGWSSKISIKDSVLSTLNYLKENQWLIN